METTSLVRNTLLLIAAGITIWAMRNQAAFEGDGLSTAQFILWGIAPYLLFSAAVYLLERFTRLRGIGVTGVVIAALMLALTSLAYLGTLGDTSSTYALIFVVIPVYLLVGSFVLLGLGALAGWVAGRRKTA